MKGRAIRDRAAASDTLDSFGGLLLYAFSKHSRLRDNALAAKQRRERTG